jgi:hypothetical protein
MPGAGSTLLGSSKKRIQYSERSRGGDGGARRPVLMVNSQHILALHFPQGEEEPFALFHRKRPLSVEAVVRGPGAVEPLDGPPFPTWGANSQMPWSITSCRCFRTADCR